MMKTGRGAVPGYYPSFGAVRSDVLKRHAFVNRVLRECGVSAARPRGRAAGAPRTLAEAEARARALGISISQD